MTDGSTNTLLLDIFKQIGEIKGDIGNIEGRLAVGAERHRDFAVSLDKIDIRTDKIETEVTKIGALSEDMKTMKPQVKDLVEFKGRMAAIMLVASTVVGAAFWLIWEGIKYFAPDVKLFLSRFFH